MSHNKTYEILHQIKYFLDYCKIKNLPNSQLHGQLAAATHAVPGN